MPHSLNPCGWGNVNISYFKYQKMSSQREAIRSVMLLSKVLLVALVFSIGSISLFAQTASDDPAAIFNEAQDLQEKGDLLGAVKLYERAIAILQNFPKQNTNGPRR
jgi:hypothetical protein